MMVDTRARFSHSTLCTALLVVCDKHLRKPCTCARRAHDDDDVPFGGHLCCYVSSHAHAQKPETIVATVFESARNTKFVVAVVRPPILCAGSVFLPVSPRLAHSLCVSVVYTLFTCIYSTCVCAVSRTHGPYVQSERITYTLAVCRCWWLLSWLRCGAPVFAAMNESVKTTNRVRRRRQPDLQPGQTHAGIAVYIVRSQHAHTSHAHIWYTLVDIILYM